VTLVATGNQPLMMWWPEAEAFGAMVGVTTRHGGVSMGSYASLNLGLHVGDDPERVRTNRQLAAETFGVDLDDLVFAEQVHGVSATIIGRNDRGRGTRGMDDAIATTDILVTNDPSIVMVMLVADCVPLALIDPVAHVLAVVHAGWRGTAGGAVARALEAMSPLGSQTERVVAFLGPGVHPDRYQVDDTVQQGLASAITPHEIEPGVARPDGAGHWKVDLVAANRQQLTLAGVHPSNIFESGTSTTDDDFFSDRAKRPCGRFALMARLLEA
jgi:hypothetical protein